MSDLRVGLIAEGETDRIVIEAALKVILDRPFVLSMLQPDTSKAFGDAGQFGGGWGGVYRWCRQLVKMHPQVEVNPTLTEFNLILVHLDADVAGMRYEESNIDNGLTDLPCQHACPPVEDSVNALRKVVAGWLNLPPTGTLPARWAYCTPSKCTEAWVVAALYQSTESAILTNIECNCGLETWLSQRPVREGRLVRSGKKKPLAYLKIAQKVTDGWESICTHCSQATRFRDEVRATLA